MEHYERLNTYHVHEKLVEFVNKNVLEPQEINVFWEGVESLLRDMGELHDLGGAAAERSVEPVSRSHPSDPATTRVIVKMESQYRMRILYPA